MTLPIKKIEEKNIGGFNFLTTKEASKISGYSPDYISRLCRTGKVVGQQIGRSWFVDPKSFEAFLNEHQEELKQTTEKLSEIRKEEYRLTSNHFSESKENTKQTLVKTDERPKEISTKKEGANLKESILSPFASDLPMPSVENSFSSRFFYGALSLFIAGSLAFAPHHTGLQALLANGLDTVDSASEVTRVAIIDTLQKFEAKKENVRLFVQNTKDGADDREVFVRNPFLLAEEKLATSGVAFIQTPSYIYEASSALHLRNIL